MVGSWEFTSSLIGWLVGWLAWLGLAWSGQVSLVRVGWLVS
jgi:hypothetical protein